MAATNLALRNAAISHAIGVRRLSTGVVNQIIKLLNKSDADLLEQIMAIDPSRSLARASLQKKLMGLRELNKDVYKSLGKEVKKAMTDIAVYEASYTGKQISAAGFDVDWAVPTRQTLVAAATAAPFNGKLLNEWVDGMATGRFNRLRDAIRIGVVQGESIDDMVKRVAGTKALNYKDGILDISRRSATAMVRTAVAHTVEAAKHASFEENEDILEGWRWVATLDTHTCPVCMELDGQTFAIGEGPDIPHHIQCRCTSVPVVQGAGSFPRVTYKTWLASQSPEVQDEALGPSRGKLYREGGLKIDQFSDDLRRPLTLEQLKMIEPRAFEDAGMVPDVGFEFVSPNVGNLTFEEAVGELGSDRQIALRAAASEVDDAVGLRTRDSNIIGAWADGAENSVLSRISSLAGDPDESWDKLQASAAMKGYLADQKSVLVFRQDDEGESFMHSFKAEGALKDIHQNLLDDGVQFHTLVPTETGAKVYVVDMDRSAHDAVEKAAERYDAEIEIQRGQAEFIGTQKQDGTDEEQRADARRVYADVIAESPVPEIQGAWDRLRDRWSETLGVDVEESGDE